MATFTSDRIQRRAARAYLAAYTAQGGVSLDQGCGMARNYRLLPTEAFAGIPAGTWWGDAGRTAAVRTLDAVDVPSSFNLFDPPASPRACLAEVAAGDRSSTWINHAELLELIDAAPGDHGLLATWCRTSGRGLSAERITRLLIALDDDLEAFDREELSR